MLKYKTTVTPNHMHNVLGNRNKVKAAKETLPGNPILVIKPDDNKIKRKYMPFSVMNPDAKILNKI